MSKQAKTGLVVLAALLLTTESVWAFSSNPPLGRTGSPASGGLTCTACHGSAVGTGSVTLMGAPTLYDPSTVYNLMVRVADPVQVGGGFQISVENPAGSHMGTLIVSDATNTQFNTAAHTFVNHNSTGVANSIANWGANGNSVTYSLQWQSPATDMGPITFWVAGNAINNNGANTGDFIYTTQTTAGFNGGPIPTVSEWGVLAMALLVLTSGTVLGLRQRLIAG